jgi:hypothetical protein
VPTLAYDGGMLGAATLFGDLVTAAFDLHRITIDTAPTTRQAVELTACVPGLRCRHGGLA